MNIFYYSGTPGKQEQRFADKLSERKCFSKMLILPAGSEFLSKESLKLRSGDLLVLCADTDESFDALLSIHEKFRDFRIILVLPRQDDELIKKAHLLCPRYITCMVRDLVELDDVVEKMDLSDRESFDRGQNNGTRTKSKQDGSR